MGVVNRMESNSSSQQGSGEAALKKMSIISIVIGVIGLFLSLLFLFAIENIQLARLVILINATILVLVNLLMRKNAIRGVKEYMARPENKGIATAVIFIAIDQTALVYCFVTMLLFKLAISNELALFPVFPALDYVIIVGFLLFAVVNIVRLFWPIIQSNKK